MSTKIYDGFKFASSDMREILAGMAAVRAKVKAMQHTKYHDVFAALLINLLDRSTLAREADKPVEMKEGFPMLKVYRWLDKRIREAKASFERDPFYDLDAYLTCWHSDILGAYVGIARGEFADEIVRILAKSGVAEAYGYWDNADAEDGVSDEEWAQRKDVWNAVIDNQNCSNFQFNFDFSPPHYTTWEELAPFAPALEQRAHQFAKNATGDVWLNAQPEKVDADNMMRLMREFHKACKTDPTWQQYLAKETSFVEKLLMSNDELAVRCKEKQFLVEIEEV